MSSDNGIYILHTKGPEYRVAHHQNIDEIYGNFSEESYQWQGDPDMMHLYFGDAPVFRTQDEALSYASKLSENYDYLEYGICIIHNFSDWDFNRLSERLNKNNEKDET